MYIKCLNTCHTMQMACGISLPFALHLHVHTPVFNPSATNLFETTVISQLRNIFPWGKGTYWIFTGLSASTVSPSSLFSKWQCESFPSYLLSLLHAPHSWTSSSLPKNTELLPFDAFSLALLSFGFLCLCVFKILPYFPPLTPSINIGGYSSQSCHLFFLAFS